MVGSDDISFLGPGILSEDMLLLRKCNWDPLTAMAYIIMIIVVRVGNRCYPQTQRTIDFFHSFRGDSKLGGGFKQFFIFTPTWGRFPI